MQHKLELTNWIITPTSSVNIIGVAGSDLYGNPGVLVSSTEPQPPQNVWTLTVYSSPPEGGRTSPSGTRQISGSVTVFATPNAQYSFDSWQFDEQAYGTTNPVTIPTQTEGSTHTLAAVFKYQPTIFSDGLETGNLNAWTNEIVQGGGTVAPSTSYAHHGSYSMKITVPSHSSSDVLACAYKDLGSNYASLYLRSYVLWTSGGPPNGDQDGMQFVLLQKIQPLALLKS